jgi:hypothetical protein
MSFFIKEENVRPGNRGGRDQFKWDNIRLLNNKDRESYLGVTQSIGFLDKGGKWRKRDWWLENYSEGQPLEKEVVNKEKESIRKEEERLIRESLCPGAKNQKILGKNDPLQKGKLTDYEWKELLKKEANFKPDDSKLFEFYENDEHKAGIGMKTSVSFRTNPFTDKNLTRLEGVGVEKEIKTTKENEDLIDNPYVSSNLPSNNLATIKIEPQPKKMNIFEKYIKEYNREKKEMNIDINKNAANNSNIIKNNNKEYEKIKKKSRSRSRSISRSERRKKDKNRDKNKNEHRHRHNNKEKKDDHKYNQKDDRNKKHH